MSGSPMVGALGSELDNPDSSPGQVKALCPWDVQEKKLQAPLLGLAKSIYHNPNPKHSRRNIVKKLQKFWEYERILK